jgi:hypothetical protein
LHATFTPDRFGLAALLLFRARHYKKHTHEPPNDEHFAFVRQALAPSAPGARQRDEQILAESADVRTAHGGTMAGRAIYTNYWPSLTCAGRTVLLPAARRYDARPALAPSTPGARRRDEQILAESADVRTACRGTIAGLAIYTNCCSSPTCAGWTMPAASCA